LIVLDASAVVELVLKTDLGSKVAERVRAPQESLHAPHLLDVEVAQVLRRFVLRGLVEEERAAEALLDLRDLDVTRYPHDVLLPRMWQLRENFSAYDAAYLALAESLDALLLTTDQRLSRAGGHGANVAVL